MNAGKLLDVCGYAGKLLIENGAEIYRVEETMVRLCKSFEEVQEAESFVISTGIMLSITIDDVTHTKVLRTRSKGVDLNCIAQINALSRESSTRHFTIDELYGRLKEIARMKHYSMGQMLFFSALSASGFALFFEGNWTAAFYSFLIGMVIEAVTLFMNTYHLNNFFINAIASGIAAALALGIHTLDPQADMDIMIISSIMLLVPGLAITNAIRDTVAGDYVSGVARALEAVIVAVAIAAGIGFVLSIGMKGGM